MDVQLVQERWTLLIVCVLVTVLALTLHIIFMRRRERKEPFSTQIQHSEVINQTKRRLNKFEIGERFNKWRKPVALYGPTESDLETQVLEELGVPTFDIEACVWEKASGIADCVLKMLLKDMSSDASDYGIQIDKFVRQGSAREGVKVCKADEFDALLLFSIDGLQFEVHKEFDAEGHILPEVCILRALYPTSNLHKCYPSLSSSGAFCLHGDLIYLNSKVLHERIFTGFIDRSREWIERSINVNPEQYHCRITRAVNQPAIKLGIHISIHDSSFDIVGCLNNISNSYRRDTIGYWGYKPSPNAVEFDVDIVPAVLIRNDKVPDPTEPGHMMDCPRYAVLKWIRDTHPFVQKYNVDPKIVWRMDTSGYEKHVLDVAHGSKEQRYILTALRILKGVFSCKKQWNPVSGMPPLQTVTVLRSYFLKQSAFYCILYYTVLHKYPLSGVREALTILLDLLQICLEERRLPHFFHTNSWLPYMFPDYNDDINALRYDLFHTTDRESLNQAAWDFRRHLRPVMRQFTCDLTTQAYDIQNKFREFVQEGHYA